MQTSTMTTSTTRTNRFPGPCSTCNTHVPAGAGFLRKIGARSIVDCAAHAGGSSGDAAANGSDAPASGGRPDVSADACAMVLALYRQADADPNVSPGHAILVAQIVRATLHCAGRSAVEIERAIKTPAFAPPRGIGADLVDEILGRTASELAPHPNTMANSGAPQIDVAMPPRPDLTSVPAPRRSRKPASSVRNAWAAMAADGEDK